MLANIGNKYTNCLHPSMVSLWKRYCSVYKTLQTNFRQTAKIVFLGIKVQFAKEVWLGGESLE